MFVTVLQILFALLVILLIIFFVFQPRRKQSFDFPDDYRDYLQDYVSFYGRLDDQERKLFDEKFEKFMSATRITGANAELEDLDRVLIGAAAVIPVFYIRDWEYINLREVIVYPGAFNGDFEQGGQERNFSGMVGNAHLENVLILSKWELRQGFINTRDTHNVAIHEFVHLVDKMDGTLDGVPEILLDRKLVPRWKQLLEITMQQIREGYSDINPYAATSPVECFAVLSEYFFQQPETFTQHHPELADLLRKIYVK